MEIKITADKKLLEALDKLAEAIIGCFEPRGPILDPVANDKGEKTADLDPLTALPAVDNEESAQHEKPAETPSESAQSVPSREDVQRIAVAKIQAKLGKQVKALIEKHGGTRVSDVPEENLAAFKAELEVLA